jgi:hypothetical protein
MDGVFYKDPDAVLDYAFDWADEWLEDDTIASYSINVPTGITVDSDSDTAGVVTVWLSGGTAGESYTVTCRVVTDAGRTDDKSMHFNVIER